MASLDDFETLQKQLTGALVSTTRSAAQIASEDVTFQRSTNPSLARDLDDRSSRLLALANKLISRAREDPKSSRTRLADVDDIDNNWKSVVDGIDSLLERADTALDEYKGYFKSKHQQEREETPGSTFPTHRSRLFRNPDLSKPQLLFEHPPSNHSTQPFKPLLASKPHARVPLQESVKLSNGQYTHPYTVEIEDYQYPARVYEQSEPVMPRPFQESQAIFVDSMDGVRAMLKELRKADEIAVDLEHHDQHSYIGIVSLMQISARNQDWIVDTLQPWRQQLQCLNEVFANPNIVKVLHGSTMDVLWLQRDLGLYLVGLFDTYHASCVLGYAGHSLAFLLKRFVDFDAQKQYQLADWRLRPLPQELFDYARSDTHFLLYIYDCMRNELIHESNPNCDKLEPVLKRSKVEALQRYEHPFYVDSAQKSSNGWYNLLWRNHPSFSDASLSVFRSVHRWRDRVARDEDENPNVILSIHSLFTISRNLPKEKPALLSFSHPLSQFVRMRIDELLEIVLEAFSHAEEGAKIRTAISESGNKFTAASSAEYEQESQSSGGSAPLVDIDPASIRASGSVFWGGMIDSSAEVVGAIPSDLDVSGLPGLQGLSADLPTALVPTDSNVEATENAGTGEASNSNHKKRKHSMEISTAHEVSSNTKADERTGSELAAERLSAEKVQALKDAAIAKVRAKSARKVHRKSKTEEGAESLEKGIVDYSKAVELEPTLGSTEADQAKAKRKKAFNPFTKGSDGDIGLGRAQQSRPGRSGTFR